VRNSPGSGGAELHVSFIADENYVMPLAAAGRSVADSRSAANLTIHVVSIGLSDRHQGQLRKSWQGDGVDVVFHEWDPSGFAGWQTGEYFTTSVYARLCLPDIITRSGRLISLDADMCVVGDLSPLLDVDLGDAAVAAVREPYTPVVSWRRGLSNWAKEGIRPETPYFNSGLMVIDLDRWREHEVRESAMAYGRRYLATMVGRDEECLNAALRGNWAELGQEWNVGPYWRLLHRRTGEFEDILRRRRVVHYQGIEKPWLKRETAEPAEDHHFLFDFLDRTEWKGWRP
jgi:lipopolysaccharide biosynthesis glycosyltransferase